MGNIDVKMVGSLGFLLATGSSGMLAPTEAGRIHGFVLTQLDTSFYRGDEKVDCPDGRSHTLREAFLATQTPADQQRLQKPENSVEFEKKYKEDYVFDAAGRDICTDSDMFDTPDRPMQKLVQSKIAPGMDLDGATGSDTAPGTCAHDSFTSPAGEKGIDNQFFRAVACNTFWRGGETGEGDALGGHQWTNQAAVVLVRDVQDWQNDPHVEVEIAPALDQVATDVKNKAVAGASLTISDDPRYRYKVKGQIKDGILTTEAANLVLPHNWLVSTGGQIIIRHLRLRIRYTPEGDLTGEAGGYQPIDNAIAMLHVGGPGVASGAGVECASVRKTLRVLADGDPDPVTKQCTSVSHGLKFNAKPAYVFDRGVLLNSLAR